MADPAIHPIKLLDGRRGYLVPWTAGRGNRCAQCHCRSEPRDCLPMPCELNSWGNPYHGQYPALVVIAARMDTDARGFEPIR